jgi:hypothetical protein
MIITNIDGSIGGSSNQLLDLLSNPEAYTAKLKALQDATTANNKTISLVGPASQVLQLRDDAVVALNTAKQKLADAQIAANEIKQAAQDEAAGLLSSARLQAQQLVADATTLKSEAGAALATAQANAKSATAAEAKAKEANAASQAATLALNNAIATAQTAEEAAQAIKAEIIAKHEKFIKSL